MEGTSVSRGGFVEHELFVWDGTIVMIVEVKLNILSGKPYHDQLAQVMCELEGMHTLYYLGYIIVSDMEIETKLLGK